MWELTPHVWELGVNSQLKETCLLDSGRGIDQVKEAGGSAQGEVICLPPSPLPW